MKHLCAGLIATILLLGAPSLGPALAQCDGGLPPTNATMGGECEPPAAGLPPETFGPEGAAPETLGPEGVAPELRGPAMSPPQADAPPIDRDTDTFEGQERIP
jgi:hypothetical protein